MKVIYKVSRFFLHISIILALCFLTFTVLDWYNPLMGFTTNALSTNLLVVFCIVTILSSVGNLILTRRFVEAEPRQQTIKDE